MGYFTLRLLFKDDHTEEHTVKRVSDLSTHKSQFLYYEKPYDEHGKGTCVRRDDLLCFECVPKTV